MDAKLSTFGIVLVILKTPLCANWTSNLSCCIQRRCQKWWNFEIKIDFFITKSKKVDKDEIDIILKINYSSYCKDTKKIQHLELRLRYQKDIDTTKDSLGLTFNHIRY